MLQRIIDAKLRFCVFKYKTHLTIFIYCVELVSGT